MSKFHWDFHMHKFVSSSSGFRLLPSLSELKTHGSCNNNYWDKMHNKGEDFADIKRLIERANIQNSLWDSLRNRLPRYHFWIVSDFL